jgi:formylmethanofuran dehydrogenase subunit E
LCSERVALAFSLDSVFGRPGVRVTCAVCGEEVLNDRQVGVPDRPLCRGCAGERYYSATAAAARVRQHAALS